jgi:metal-sulfur cluster biosynthetic enzyme
MPLPNEDSIRNALRAVDDPEVGMNIVDLGLVYRVAIVPERIEVAMTMTTPACPMGSLIVDQARDAIRAIVPKDVEVEVNLVWDPPWSPAMLSERAREAFGWKTD